jgi:hypothetical protein
MNLNFNKDGKENNLKDYKFLYSMEVGSSNFSISNIFEMTIETSYNSLLCLATNLIVTAGKKLLPT